MLEMEFDIDETIEELQRSPVTSDSKDFVLYANTFLENLGKKAQAITYIRRRGWEILE